jgi:hypothetical protein
MHTNSLPKQNRISAPQSLDFQSDALADSRRFRIFAVVHDFTRECPALIADTSHSRPVTAHPISPRPNRRPLRANREASKHSTDPTSPAHSHARSRSKPGRVTIPPAERPKSSSITSMSRKPRRRATSTSSYFRDRYEEALMARMVRPAAYSPQWQKEVEMRAGTDTGDAASKLRRIRLALSVVQGWNKQSLKRTVVGLATLVVLAVVSLEVHIEFDQDWALDLYVVAFAFIFPIF